jgi:hypothetical protein
MVFTTSVVRQNYPNFVIRSNFIQALLISKKLLRANPVKFGWQSSGKMYF